jgi:adenylosuccinate lyase
MTALWSDEGKLSSWLEVELAALEGWAELGVVPREDAEKVAAAAKTPDPVRVREIEASITIRPRSSMPSASNSGPRGAGSTTG